MKGKTRRYWITKIDESLERILNNLDEEVSCKDIAIQSVYSHYHFHRNFKKLTGESVTDCIRRLRLERAVHLLRNTDLRITDIALESGYETPEAFTKAFISAYGITPSKLRKFPAWDGKTHSIAGIHYSLDGCLPSWFPIMSTGGINMDIKITELSAMKFVCLRNTGDYWKLPQTWQMFHSKLSEQKAYWPGAKFMILFHDHYTSTPMEQKRSDTAMVINDDFVPRDDLFIYDFPGGKYAVIAHFGSYEEIGKTWDTWRNEWLPDSGWEINSSLPSLEWYQNDPNTVPPELLLTLLCEPVKKQK